MPNWSQNRLLVKGEVEKVKKFIKKVKSKQSPFDFNRLIPIPKPLTTTNIGYTLINDKAVNLWTTNKDNKPCEISEQTRKRWLKKYGVDNWYDWCRANWGTKWNACNVQYEIKYEKEYATALYQFDTAWTPPYTILAYLVKNFPDLEIEFQGFVLETGLYLAMKSKNGQCEFQTVSLQFLFCREEDCQGMISLAEERIIEELSSMCLHLEEEYGAIKSFHSILDEDGNKRD